MNMTTGQKEALSMVADAPDASVAEQQQHRVSVWLLTNAPSPYQVELLTAVERETGVELDVRFMRDQSAAAPGAAKAWAFSHRVLRGLFPSKLRDEFQIHPRALWETAFGRRDCYVLSGLYTSLTFLMCAMILIVRRKPWVLWLERPRGGQFRMKWASGSLLRKLGLGLRQKVLRTLLRWSHGTIAIGTAAVETYADIGADRAKLMMLPYCCDVSRFAQADESDLQAVRERHELIGKTVYLFSGQMIHRKGIDTLLAAFGRIAEGRDDLALLLLGDGLKRAEYEAAVPELLKAHVHFAGFRKQAELPAYFAAADVFAFPSRHDGWAVVINEACGASLPIVASHQTGAAWDLVIDGKNGFMFDAEDVDKLTEHLAYFAEHPESLAPFGRRSLERVQRFSVESGADQFQQHIQQVLSLCHPTDKH
ncbi:MAG: glycosyltransferase family 4 protein [Phycisphaeraceae bacterium]